MQTVPSQTLHRELELVQQNTQIRKELRDVKAELAQLLRTQGRYQERRTSNWPGGVDGASAVGKGGGRRRGKRQERQAGERRKARNKAFLREQRTEPTGTERAAPLPRAASGVGYHGALRPGAAAALVSAQRRSSGQALRPRTLIIPEGGSLALECKGGSTVRGISFASFGTPTVHANGSAALNPECHSERSRTVVEAACLGQSHCCLPVSGENFGADPCHGKIKTLAVVVHGCDVHEEYTRFKRHCSLQGQWLLCDEDIDFLARLELPEAPQPLLPAVAIMVDTSWRPKLQHYVVTNVMNQTGWPVQIFHGPTNGPQLRALFASQIAARSKTHRGSNSWLTLTDLGDDYMEDWVRLSSMMLLDVFWRATIGEKVLVFQPDTIMCPSATRRIDDFLQYDFVGPPMGGAWWMTSDHDSQWGVGCGGFSLRDRTKSITMSNTPACITPAAGKLEDQQLGASWKHIERRCADAGIVVRKPSRFDAVQFAVEYDLHMDVLPGDDPAMPDGCTAGYYVGPKTSSNGKPKWNPMPPPAKRRCPLPHFVPLGCHKCWFWNYKTWRFMVKHCPQVKVMRALRKEYRIGIEFTDWPTRPKPKPIKGPILPDARWKPIDMLEDTCVGTCGYGKPRRFKKSVKGLYHK